MAERADGFKDLSHKIGLTADQAKAVHDWAADNAVSDYKSITENLQGDLTKQAEEATGALEKLWGPLDGDTAKANIALANRAMTVNGGGLKDELGKLGLLGPAGEVLSAPLATALADLGAAVFQEGDLLHGQPAVVGNPYAEGEHFNMTEQMRLYNADPDHAIGLIRAAGKKPSDFGIPGRD